MKKLHKLVLKAFFGPFLVTFSVVVFILLMITLAKYLDEISGKGIPASTFAELFFYFSFNSTQLALPLAILLSALMTYGNLGQHNELIAIKSSGVSLVRIISPLFIGVCLIAVADFFFNDYVLPKTNIKAYSLLYDMRQKKPDFDLREKVFYNGIPGYSIRVEKKNAEDETLKKILIYDHSSEIGNTEVVYADSGKMSSILGGSYMQLDLYNGHRSAEEHESGKSYQGGYTRTTFSKSTTFFDLSSFALERTPEKLFERNRKMLSIKEMSPIMDSLLIANAEEMTEVPKQLLNNFNYGYIDTVKNYKGEFVGKVFTAYENKVALKAALNTSRIIYSQLENRMDLVRSRKVNHNRYGIELLHNYTNAAACIIMFLIGAPLGVVIKKGGMGIPALITISFFILYYIISITGEKMAKNLSLDYMTGTWLSNLTLLPFAALFIYLAYKDAKVF